MCVKPVERASGRRRRLFEQVVHLLQLADLLLLGFGLMEIPVPLFLCLCDAFEDFKNVHRYTSRVGNGHTVPSIETLAKYAQALEIPLYQLFYDGEEAPKKIKGVDLDGEKLSLGERREIESLGRKFAKLKERDKGLVRLLVAKLAQATA